MYHYLPPGRWAGSVVTSRLAFSLLVCTCCLAPCSEVGLFTRIIVCGCIETHRLRLNSSLNLKIIKLLKLKSQYNKTEPQAKA